MPYVIEYNESIQYEDIYQTMTNKHSMYEYLDPINIKLFITTEPNSPKIIPVGFIGSIDGDDIMLDFRNNKLYNVATIFSRNRQLYHKFGNVVDDSLYKQMIALL